MSCCQGGAPAARRLTKFNGVHSVDLHIPANFGASHTRIHFIGLKGEFTEVRPRYVRVPLGMYKCGMEEADMKMAYAQRGGGG